MNPLLNSLREYYQNNGELDLSFLELIDKTITMLVKRNESTSPGFTHSLDFRTWMTLQIILASGSGKKNCKKTGSNCCVTRMTTTA